MTKSFHKCNYCSYKDREDMRFMINYSDDNCTCKAEKIDNKCPRHEKIKVFGNNDD